MGLIMTIEVESGLPCPQGFSNTDSKLLVRWLAEGHSWGIEMPDHIGSIAESLGVSTGPLKTVVAEMYPLEDYLASAGDDPVQQQRQREQWEYESARTKESWHPPDAFIDTLETLIKALQKDTEVFERLEIETSYFLNGFFEQDLQDVLKAAQWAEEQGENLMRLVAV